MCQRHSRAIKDFGLASAFFLIEQVSQANVFSEEGVLLVFMGGSFFQGLKYELGAGVPATTVSRRGDALKQHRNEGGCQRENDTPWYETPQRYLCTLYETGCKGACAFRKSNTAGSN